MKPQPQFSLQIESDDEDHGEYESQATERNLITQTISDKLDKEHSAFESPTTNMRGQPGLGQPNSSRAITMTFEEVIGEKDLMPLTLKNA